MNDVIKAIVVCASLCISLIAQSQELMIVDCALNPTDISARTEARRDFNDELCALVKVNSPVPLTKVNGNVIDNIVTVGDSQYWVYCTTGTRQLELFFEKYPPVMLVLSDYNQSPAEGGMTINVSVEDIVNQDKNVLRMKMLAFREREMYVPFLKTAKILADKGDTEAQLFIGAYYLETVGDNKEAYKWFELSAAGSTKASTKAQIILGTLELKEGRVEKGVSWLEKALEAGDDGALSALVNLYNGSIKNEKLVEYVDHEKALKYALRGASKGDKNFQHFCACCYAQGHGTSKNMSEAVHWFTLSATQGHAASQRLLGALLITGYENTPPNLTEAERWLRMAAAQGDEEAIELLSTIKD